MSAGAAIRIPEPRRRPESVPELCVYATRDGRRRLPEYREWLRYVAEQFAFLRTGSTALRLHVVPEFGHSAPAYGLSLFPDTWNDAKSSPVTCG